MIFFRKGRTDSGRLLSDMEREAIGIFVVGASVGAILTTILGRLL